MRPRALDVHKVAEVEGPRTRPRVGARPGLVCCSALLARTPTDFAEGAGDAADCEPTAERRSARCVRSSPVERSVPAQPLSQVTRLEQSAATVSSPSPARCMRYVPVRTARPIVTCGTTPSALQDRARDSSRWKADLAVELTDLAFSCGGPRRFVLARPRPATVAAVYHGVAGRERGVTSAARVGPRLLQRLVRGLTQRDVWQRAALLARHDEEERRSALAWSP